MMAECMKWMRRKKFEAVFFCESDMNQVYSKFDPESETKRRM
ncbi:hypothetical protein ACQ0QQ_02010 [Lysinibacillus sphaericus]